MSRFSYCEIICWLTILNRYKHISFFSLPDIYCFYKPLVHNSKPLKGIYLEEFSPDISEAFLYVRTLLSKNRKN